MNYNQCGFCKLTLPTMYLSPIKVQHNGKVFTVLACQNCIEEGRKEIKRRNQCQ